MNFIDSLPNNGLSGCVRRRHSFTSLKAKRSRLRTSNREHRRPDAERVAVVLAVGTALWAVERSQRRREKQDGSQSRGYNRPFELIEPTTI
jgi:hypothetical protein